MVTGLQLALKDFFPGKTEGKAHSKEVESVPGSTFGGILRAKEKQLQDAQTVNASAIVAAVAVVQNLPLAKLVSEMIVSGAFVETQAVDVETGYAVESETPKAPACQTIQAEKLVSITETAVDVEREERKKSLESDEPEAVQHESDRSSRPTKGQPVIVLARENTSPANNSDENPVEFTGKTSASQAEPVSQRAQSVHPDQSALYAEPSQDVPILAGKQIVNEQSAAPEHVHATTKKANNIPAIGGVSSKLDLSRQAQTDTTQTAEHVEGTEVPVTQDLQQSSVEQPAKRSGVANPNPFNADRKIHETRFSKDIPKPETNKVNLTVENTKIAFRLHGQHPADRAPAPAVPSNKTMEKDQPDQVTSQLGKHLVGSGKTKVEHNVSEPAKEVPQPEAEGVEFHQASTEVRKQGLPGTARPPFGTESVEKLEVPVGEKILLDKAFADRSQPAIEVVSHMETPAFTSARSVIAVPPEGEHIGAPVTENSSRAEVRIVPGNREGVQSVSRNSAPSEAPVQSPREIPAMSVQSGETFPTVVTETVEPLRRGDAPATGMSQTKSVLDPIPVETNLKPGGHQEMPGQTVRERGQLQGGPNGTGNLTGESPVSVGSAQQQAVQPSVKPDSPEKTHARQAAVGLTQNESRNEKTYSTEPRQAANPGSESMAVRAYPVRESTVESVAGKGSGNDAKFQPAEVVQQIVRHIEARVQNRSTEMHLQLNPKELGMIDVQVVSGPQGVSVTFSAEQPATGRLLETQLSQLHQSLTEAGVQIAGLNVGQHSQPRQEGGFFNQNPQFTQPPERETSHTEGNVKETRRPVRLTGASGEVDYLI